MLRNLGSKPASLSRGASGDGGQPITDRDRLQMLDAFEEADIAWFWATDA
jgi:hypothetical protein